MNPANKKTLFTQPSANITERTVEGQVSYGQIEINPEVYVIEGGKPRRLVDLLGLQKSDGKYLLTLRGITTHDGEEIWAGKQVIERLNSRPGIHLAANNMSDFYSFARSYQKSYSKIIEAKMRIDALATINEVTKKLEKQFGSEYKIQVRRADLMNLVDPFMPVDPRLTKDLKWNMDNHLDFKVYANIEDMPGGSQAYVGNTNVSYARIQDVDADTLMMLQVRIVDQAGKVKGTWLWDKKFPHTTHQVGSYLAKGRRDLEGDVYDKFKVYRRIVSPWGQKGVYSDGQGIREIMGQAADLAKKMSVNTYRDRDQLAETIAKTIRADLTGIFTTKQWQHEALQFENILNYIPEYLATELQLSKSDSRIEELVKFLNKTGNKAALRLKYNMGLKGARLKGTEGILKMRDLGDIRTNEHLEALFLKVAYSMQDRILAAGQMDKYGYDESRLLTTEFMTADPLTRMKMIMGHQSPTFTKSKGYQTNRKHTPVEIIPDTELKLRSGAKRVPIIDTLKSMKIRDQVTGTTDNMLKVQEIDFESVLSKEYLDQIDPKLRGKATKGYIVTMNGLDPKGNLVRKPLGGAKFPTTLGDTELSWVLLPTLDVTTGEMVDPLELLKNKVEVAAKYKLSPYSHIHRYGLGELVGAYSLENLRRPGSVKYLRRLAEANKVPLERVQSLVNSRSATSVEILKQFKLQLDLVSQGDMGTTVEQDIRRLLETALGAMGVDVQTVRDRSGNVYLKNEHIVRHLSEMVTLTTSIQNLNPEETAKYIAGNFSKFPTLAAVKPSQNDATTFFGIRAVQQDGRMTALSAGDILFDPKRKLKIAKMAQHSIDAGDFRVAVVTMDFKEQMLKDMGLIKENGKWIRPKDKHGNLLPGAFGDKANFQAEYIDEGFAALTESGTRKMQQAILNNLQPGVDYTFERPKGQSHSYRIWDSLEGKYRTVYTKEPIEFNRVAHTRVGDIRIFPHAGAIGKAVATRGGIQEEVDMFLSLGELMSKSGAPEMMRQLVSQAGGDAERAWDEAVKAGMNSKQADEFIQNYQDILGSAVSFVLNNKSKEKIEASGIPVYNVGLQIRNLDADRQIHAFSAWGTWSDQVQAYTHQGGNVEGLILKGQANMDSMAEFGFGFHRFLSEQGFMPEGLGVSDLLDVIYEGLDKAQGTSIFHQVGNSASEDQIQAVAKAIYIGTASMKSQYKNMAQAESEAMQALSLDKSKQYNLMQEAFKKGIAAAIGTAGTENADTILRAVMAGLVRF
jgi:hypothetical protein